MDEVYEYYDNEVVKIVNLKQFLFYCSVYHIQPDWIDKSVYDDKVVAYYGKARTKECWEAWKRRNPDIEEKQNPHTAGDINKKENQTNQHRQ